MKVMVPLSVRLPAGVICSVTAPIRSCAVITGASLVPVMVTSICLVIMPPLLSSSVMVKLSTLVWPAARYSTAESATCRSRSAGRRCRCRWCRCLDRRQRAERRRRSG